MTRITLQRPDDWHIHLRDGEMLAQTAKHASRYFGRAIVMPNLQPPITTVAQALAYRERIAAHASAHFQPLLTLYLTDHTSLEEIKAAAASSHVHAIKLYPAGATTNSAQGVSDLSGCYDQIEAMAELGLPLLVHGEVTDAHVDIFDREKVFIDTMLTPMLERFPKLSCVLEHITTKDAVDFVAGSTDNVAATITAHHLLYNRNDMLVGGIKPHYYCLPILKRSTHQQALRDIVATGNPAFFLGTDSAPHDQQAKECGCGSAGSYTAHAAIELYAQVFDELGALDMLEGFASHHGPDFYGLPRNLDTITLEKHSWQPPQSYTMADNQVIPLNPTQPITWRVLDI